MMVEKTSLTSLEIRIIKFFIDNIMEQFGIREIARKTKTDYKLVHTTVQKLVKKGILLKKRQANLDLCSLNLKGNLTTIYYVEMLRAKEFKNNHPELKIFFNDISDKTKEMFYCLVIFGSFAKGTETKNSDIDILIITPKRDRGEEIGRIIHTQNILINKQANYIILEDKEFTNALLEKGINVQKEAFKNHILVTGVEAFYNAIKQNNGVSG